MTLHSKHCQPAARAVTDSIPLAQSNMKYFGFILANLLLTFTASAHGISDADRQGILEGGNLEYIKLGATHMLTGYDHLLFLLGVMFFLTRFGDIVKFITAFTSGKSALANLPPSSVLWRTIRSP